MRNWAAEIVSGVPVMVIFRSLAPSSQLEILICAPDACRISLILLPPLPMIHPTRSFGMVISCVWVGAGGAGPCGLMDGGIAEASDRLGREHVAPANKASARRGGNNKASGEWLWPHGLYTRMLTQTLSLSLSQTRSLTHVDHVVVGMFRWICRHQVIF